MWRFVILLLLAGLLAVAAPLHPVVPAAAQPSAHFDAQAATQAWLDSLPQGFRTRSDAYFEGGYWLQLWDFLITVAFCYLVLRTRLSARMRDWAERRVRYHVLRSMLYWAQFAVLTAVVTFPWTVYENFLREHQYGLSNQTFGSWFRDQAIGLVLTVLIGGMIVAGLFRVVRSLPRTWHIWGAAVAIVFVMIGAVLYPVFIVPLFNSPKPLASSPIKTEILNLAHASGIPANDVYQIDASRQSNRVSANVSGMFGTMRITLNDNLLNRCSPEAVLSVMGHEMGHYVLGHVMNQVIFLTLEFAVVFTFLKWALGAALQRWGDAWGVTGIGDLAVLPLALILLSTIMLILTPVNNTFTRTQEYQADLYGINSARQPDGEAEVDLLLGEYRKLDPGPVEEFLFYDHPGGRTRIYAAMRWKAENLCLFDPALPCGIQPR